MISGVLAVKAIGVSDAYFVGQLGEARLAAISYTFPVVMTLISLAIGLSAGASSVLSRAIGADASAEKQAEIVTGAAGMAVLVSIAMSVLGFLFIGPVLSLMGAEGDILKDATWFMQIWFCGVIFLVLPVATNGMLRATGDGVSPAILMSGTAILNIAINPVFIFGLGPIPELGMQGAAVATITARAVATVGAFYLLWRKNLLALSTASLVRGLRRWQEVARIGLPASLSTSVNPIALSIATAAVSTLGSAEVAAFGLVTKIQSFAVVPLLALSAASAPFVGQNSGAGNTGRSRDSLWFCARVSLVWALVLAVAFYFGGRWLVSFFTESARTQEIAALYLAIVPASYAGYGLIVSLTAAMNGLGRSVSGLMIGAGRAIGLLAPGAWIGVLTGGFLGLAIATFLANTVSGVIAALIVMRHSLKDIDQKSAYQPDCYDSE
ncbi:MATE family efflux transporter [Henriciella mobilis]|uniref:MATE family efflux transporter n=2 Tax=Henriciella mobilis TaxID=2305467 RepID=A0A399R9A7_9PROT|nr:MATE family efflux transporter [Henriciella mobilis]